MFTSLILNQSNYEKFLRAFLFWKYITCLRIIFCQLLSRFVNDNLFCSSDDVSKSPLARGRAVWRPAVSLNVKSKFMNLFGSAVGDKVLHSLAQQTEMCLSKQDRKNREMKTATKVFSNNARTNVSKNGLVSLCKLNWYVLKQIFNCFKVDKCN